MTLDSYAIGYWMLRERPNRGAWAPDQARKCCANPEPRPLGGGGGILVARCACGAESSFVHHQINARIAGAADYLGDCGCGRGGCQRFSA